MKVICPEKVELSKDARTNVCCTEEGCGKVFAHPMALRLHRIKLHKLLMVNESFSTSLVLEANVSIKKLSALVT